MNARITRGIYLVVLLLASAPAGAQETAEYRVTLDATWSATTHPIDFPGDPHFSPLIGGTHTAAVEFWAPGELASNGIEVMAETGGGSPLADEISAQVGAGNAFGFFFNAVAPSSPGTSEATFTADRDFPLVTLVTMVAPSPDWFVGVHGLPLYENGEWVAQEVVTLFAYDSGTDSGSTFESANQDTQPREPISLITSGPLGNGVPVATFTFTRTDAPPPVAVPVLGGWAIGFLALTLGGAGALSARRG